MINFEGNSNINKGVQKLVFDKIDKILPADKIEELLTKIRARAEFEMTDTGTFKQITEKMTNHKPVIELGDISLSIKSASNLNSCTDRVLETSVATKSGQYIIKKPLVEGKREDILNYLNNENFAKNFKEYLVECSDNFSKKGLD